MRGVGLPSATLDRRVEVLSKGMRQKVGILIAMMRGAAALLLDEPSSGLDPVAATQLEATFFASGDYAGDRFRFPEIRLPDPAEAVEIEGVRCRRWSG